MNIQVLAPTYWATQQLAESKCWLYLASCRKFGIVPTLYGVGSTSYKGGGYMRMYGQMECASRMSDDVTHILFSDAWDVLFLQPMDEIIRRYKLLGCPPWLIGATQWGFLDLNAPEVHDAMALPYFDTPHIYRWPSTTFWMGERKYIIEQISKIESQRHNETWEVYRAFRE